MISLGLKYFFTIILLVAFFCSCSLFVKEDETIKHYQLDKPEKFLMPESLLEVSGITFNNGKNDTIYAIQDEQGRLFRLGWGVKKQVNAKFGKQGDYEDVAIVNDKVIILKSNGNLITFPLADAVYAEIDDAQEWKGLLPAGEYEVSVSANEPSVAQSENAGPPPPGNWESSASCRHRCCGRP